MNLIFGILAVSLIALFASAKSENESVFEQNFKVLHREPPPPPAISRATVETLWIDQKLDHFDENNEKTWKMRYMANGEFFKDGAPVFIFVGGEWTISNAYLLGGHMYDMAKEHHGYLFYTEHRYYGESRPTSDLSRENLKYLHVKQALADLAHFIRTMKATMPGMADSKFILTGGSYSASMVTWFKKVYPDLAVGCWASSAPLFAKANFVEYKEVTGESIRKVGGEDCYNRIENAIFEMESMFANKRGAEIKAMLKLCNTFDETNDLDLWTFFSEISDLFAGVVQGHNGEDIQNCCKHVMQGNDDVSSLATFLLGRLKKGCTDFSYKGIIQSLLNSAYTNGMSRQWTYQTCNEYGWYQTSGSRNQPFGTKFPVLLYTTMCSDIYGEKFTIEYIQNQIKETNDYFGGYQPNVENVYITHGELDPWRTMGIQTKNESTIIPMHAHCKDFGSIKDSDTPEMRASKERIAQLVREWVAGNK